MRLSIIKSLQRFYGDLFSPRKFQSLKLIEQQKANLNPNLLEFSVTTQSN